MKKLNYKKIAAHSTLWIILICLGYFLIDIAYIKPLSKWAYSFKSGLFISVMLTIFYIGLIKVISWVSKGFYWLIDNI